MDALRQTIDGELPEYNATTDIDRIFADIVRYGQTAHTPALTAASLPHDAIVQLFPGGDIPETGSDSLIHNPGRHRAMSMAPIAFWWPGGFHVGHLRRHSALEKKRRRSHGGDAN